MSGNDSIAIEILPDGTIKVTSDQISGPNHQNAEQFLRFMAELAGGETTRTRRKDVHHQAHSHSHQQA